MQLITRKYGSQRTSKPVSVTIEPNWGGQGGSQRFVLKDENDRYLIIVPESEEEARQLVSAAHIVMHNYRDERKL
ncbi:hypothetical protein [Agrobacterium pusense]|uniref:hypothetical protein n=1 Tax=Agrobacterium pusense TaxID=648995 RepID=UPI00384A4C11